MASPAPQVLLWAGRRCTLAVLGGFGAVVQNSDEQEFSVEQEFSFGLGGFHSTVLIYCSLGRFCPSGLC